MNKSPAMKANISVAFQSVLRGKKVEIITMDLIGVICKIVNFQIITQYKIFQFAFGLGLSLPVQYLHYIIVHYIDVECFLPGRRQQVENALNFGIPGHTRQFTAITEAALV